MSTLQGKVALVTGTSSGLGAQTALLFSRYGATVFGIGRETGRLADVFADIEHGSHASADVSSASACRDAVERFVGEFGGLDVLVNIAGRHQMRRTESMTDDDWAAISSTSPPLPASSARPTRPATVPPSTG